MREPTDKPHFFAKKERSSLPSPDKSGLRSLKGRGLHCEDLMKNFLILMLFLLTCLGCGDGIIDLITGDVVSDAADCFEGVNVVEDSYIVVMDKPCIDLEISDIGAVPTGETFPNEETVPIEVTTPKLASDWEHVVTLPRQNLAPHRFRMVDEWIDPIQQAYVDGKDFLFVIYSETFVRQKHFFLDQPEPPSSARFVWHFPDPDAWWFQYWGNAAFQNREKAGFTIEFDSTPMPEPSFPGAVKEREYLFSPEFGTSLEGHAVGLAGAPEIKAGFLLKIYAR